MAFWAAGQIKRIKKQKGLAAAQDIYRGLFISTTDYAEYKADVDTMLTIDGYADCIVTA